MNMLTTVVLDPAVLAQDVVERTSTGEAVQFWILAVVAVVGGGSGGWSSRPRPCTRRSSWR